VLQQALQALAPFLARELVLYSILGALVLWASVSGLQLFRAARAASGSLRLAMTQLGEDADPVAFVGRYEAASAVIARDRLLGNQWRGFRQGLLIPSMPALPVFTTRAAADIFDLGGMLRSGGADLRYHAALPGLLVGAGLLVTFLGLAAALSSAGSVVAEGVTQQARNAALRDLLSSAAVKFITSVAALALSILYALWRKWCLKRVEAEFSRFLDALEERIPLKTQAALQADANAILAKQYADVQRIGSDFFVNLGSTLEREFGAGLQQHLKPLAEALDKLSAGLATQNEDALQSMLKSFLEKLEGAVGDSMRATAHTLENLGQRLDGLQGAMDAAAERMGKAADDMAARLGTGTEAALRGITEQMSGLVRALRDAADEAGRNNRDAGEELARRMAETAAALTMAVGDFQRAMGQGAADGVARLAEPLQAMVQQLRQMAEEQRSAGAQSTASLSETVERAAAALEVTATRIAEVLGGGATDASSRLVAATEAMREDLRQVLERFGATLDASSTAITRGAEAGGDVLRGAAQTLGADVSAAAGELRVAAEAAGSALREGGIAASAGMTAAASTLSTGADGLTERLRQIGSSVEDLARQAQTLDRVLRSAAEPLSGATGDLRFAAEAAREAISPWRDTAQALRAAVDGLLTAATAMEVGQRGAAELTTRLAAVSDRFGGLDTSLAGTLRVLQEALAGYQTAIAQFVAGVDTGLEKSVGQLAAVAKSLQDTAEELVDRK
jgi:DNA anti-recombination protein RmuC